MQACAHGRCGTGQRAEGAMLTELFSLAELNLLGKRKKGYSTISALPCVPDPYWGFVFHKRATEEIKMPAVCEVFLSGIGFNFML